MNGRVLQRLFWKDFQTIKPLLMVVFLGILAIHLLLLFLQYIALIDVQGRAGASLAFSVMLPNLLAFSAGAVLIASEEESGSLAWLGTLPAKWYDIATSKFAVAFVTLVASWTLAGIGILVQRFLAEDILPSSDDTPWFWVSVGQLAVSLTLLLIGFGLSYGFRSPIVALLISLPALLGTFYFFMGSVWLIVPDVDDSSKWADVPGSARLQIALIGIVEIAFLLAGCFAAARWRLSRPDRSTSALESASKAIDGFRPPVSSSASWYAVSLSQKRHSPWTALLWQTWRQNGGKLVVATLVGVVAIAKATVAFPPQGWGVFALLSAMLCIAVISAVPFHNDTVRERCRFFADRGLSPTLVWWTRILFPSIAIGLILSSYLISAQYSGASLSMILLLASLIVFAFAIGQFVSQWSSRPVIAYFAAPVVMWILLTALSPLAVYVNRVVWSPLVLSLAIPVLMFASYMLTEKWMRREIDRSYTYRSIGALVFVVMIPYVVLVIGRRATAPAFDRSWRDGVVAFQYSKSPQYKTPLVVQATPLMDHQWTHIFERSKENTRRVPESEELARFELELNSQRSIGQHLSLVEVYSHMTFFSHIETDGQVGQYPPEIAIDQESTELDEELDSEAVEELARQCLARDLRGCEVLLHWSNLVRQDAIHGGTNAAILKELSEKSESQVATVLLRYVRQYGVDAKVLRLSKMFPDQELVMESRENSWVKYWGEIILAEKRFTRNEARVLPAFSDEILKPLVSENWPDWLSFERSRIMVDADNQFKDALFRLKNEYDAFRPATNLTEGQFDEQESAKYGAMSFFVTQFMLRDRMVATLLDQIDHTSKGD